MVRPVLDLFGLYSSKSQNIYCRISLISIVLYHIQDNQSNMICAVGNSHNGINSSYAKALC